MVGVRGCATYGQWVPPLVPDYLQRWYIIDDIIHTWVITLQYLASVIVLDTRLSLIVPSGVFRLQKGDVT